MKILMVMWSSNFFAQVSNTSDIGGGIVKLGYLHHYYKTKPKEALKIFLPILFLDKLFTIWALIIFSGIISFCFFQDLVNFSPLIEQLIQYNYYLFAVTISSSSIFISKKARLFFYNHFKINASQFLFTGFLGFISNSFSFAAFWFLIKPMVLITPPFVSMFSFMPISTIFTSLPIGPAGGIGLGNIIFDHMFSFLKISNGASLANLYFISMFFFDLLGFIAYLLLK